MAESPTVLEEIHAFTIRRGRRPLGWLAVAAPAAVIGFLFLPTVVASPWAPVIHWGCQRSSLVAAGAYAVPVVLANAPYGGMAWANGTGAAPATVVASNGAAIGGFVSYRLELFRTHNVSLPSPGANHHCLARYQLVLEGVAPAPVTLVPLLPTGAVSDRGEPGTVPAGTALALPSVGFSNGYTSATGGSLSTCGSSSPRSLSVSSLHLWIDATFSTAIGPVTVNAAIVAPQAIHYWFPAGFGTWSVDVLGAGYAFAYVPCGTAPAS